MTHVDCYSGVGYALELLAQSEYHRQFPVGDYLRVEILPPLWHGQIRFYLELCPKVGDGLIRRP
jgi:cytolysin-activating lysine-acyltransferase